MRRLVPIAMLAAGLLAAACSSSSSHKDSSKPTTPTTLAARGGERLEFRPVLGEIPYKPATAKGTKNAWCNNGKRVTPAAKITADANATLADETKHSCLLLGPALLNGKAIDRVTARPNPNQGDWVVDVHFANDDFTNKIGRPMVGKRVAIVLDHQVISAPSISPGITSRDVTISGPFRPARAEAIAQDLR